MLPEDDIRRRRLMQEALNRGLQPSRSDPNAPLAQTLRNIPHIDIPRGLEGIAIGEDYGKSRPGLYRIGQSGSDVNISPFKFGRQPMDERLPSGESPNDLVARLARRPMVAVPPNAGLALPQPTQPNINVGGIEPPQPSQPAAPPTTPRIGYSTAGLTGVDRLMQRRRALEEADPESRVTDSGEILPPEKTGRLKGLGEGVALAASQYDPSHKLYSLGRAIGGGLTGAISPRSSAKQMRKFELSQLDDDLARGLKLEAAQNEIRGPRMGQMSTRVVSEGEYPGIEAGTEIRVRVDPRTGAITDVVGPNNKPVISDLAKRPASGSPHYESDADGYLITVQGGTAERVKDRSGNPVKVKSKNASGEVVEVEVNGRTLRVTPGQALSYYGQVGERESKRSAAQAEYDQLVEDEKKAGAEKNAAYAAMEKFRKDHPSMSLDDVDVYRQMEDEAKRLNTIYQSFGDKKRDAQRKMTENAGSTSPSTAQPYAGRTMSTANLARYAKDKGISEDEARKQVEAQGVRVQ